jgi:hypothetical protein
VPAAAAFTGQPEGAISQPTRRAQGRAHFVAAGVLDHIQVFGIAGVGPEYRRARPRPSFADYFSFSHPQPPAVTFGGQPFDAVYQPTRRKRTWEYFGSGFVGPPEAVRGPFVIPPEIEQEEHPYRDMRISEARAFSGFFDEGGE